MNKKVIIGIIIAVVLIGIAFGAYYFLSNRPVSLKDKGNTGNDKQELLEQIKNTKNETIKREKINFVLEHNLITEEEANALY